MSGFGSHAMHNNFRLTALLLLCVISLPVAAQAPSTSGEEDAEPPAGGESSKPEHTRRALPADTFKPSEEVSEDFPVPFPVDI